MTERKSHLLTLLSLYGLLPMDLKFVLAMRACAASNPAGLAAAAATNLGRIKCRQLRSCLGFDEGTIAGTCRGADAIIGVGATVSSGRRPVAWNVGGAELVKDEELEAGNAVTPGIFGLP